MTEHRLSWAGYSSFHFQPQCSCGWVGTSQIMEKDAKRLGEQHKQEAVELGGLTPENDPHWFADQGNSMRFYLPDLTEVPQPYKQLARGPKSDYSEAPTHLRVYFEDEYGDDFPWCLDAVDAQGAYSEEVERFSSKEEAMAARAEFAAQNITEQV